MSRGGFRVGSGRKVKVTDKADIRIMFRITKNSYDIIDNQAKKEKLSVGQYVRKIALEKLENNNY